MAPQVHGASHQQFRQERYHSCLSKPARPNLEKSHQCHQSLLKLNENYRTEAFHGAPSRRLPWEPQPRFLSFMSSHTRRIIQMRLLAPLLAAQVAVAVAALSIRTP